MSDKPSLNIQALEVDALAKLLSKSARRRITAEMLRSDIAAGAPVNPDGTMNLIYYAAWLNVVLAGGAESGGVPHGVD